MSQFVFETAPKIVCEQGASRQLGALASQLGVSHMFVVTDRFLHESGLLAGALESLAAAGIKATVFSDVLADPPEASVLAAVEQARKAGVDGVAGFGGGSSMDTAKLVALLVKTPQSLPEIYGIGLARGPRLPLVQVPTTAGTGSEVTAISILTTPSNEKKGVVSSLLYPDVALLDSLLTLGLPPRITAMTGVDAMVHAIESFTTRTKKNPLSDSLAMRALTLLYNNIRTVIRDGADADAREAMLLGSLFAGMAFANAPVAAVHALAYPLGGHYHLPHGLTNALVLVPVLEFNRDAAAPLYAELARAMLPGRSFANDAEATGAFIDAIRTLVAEMPFEQDLKSAGVPESDLEMLARDAMNVQRLLVNNPRDVSYEDALAIYRAAY
ncbi:iron-containing alcohol dehydrogenase [Noviherbaspirillum sp. UKPF54]|uniref:iron-containing alcohol dehydrogenase n=1 Tax=Noviherbaspirillum sp. UKPF54 TaxID=2601898 RepID=UPI0011B160C3|nr:iron-containing alcohol dehydrogenase [Noviherbaspirillum sp. UKPF54]QDZ27535.1 iron-containing alcohol dehydrogenase [Noviherbaspirillum sp. UKPF54]